eukprot:6457537-Amphidinium_carterae.1
MVPCSPDPTPRRSSKLTQKLLVLIPVENELVPVDFGSRGSASVAVEGGWGDSATERNSSRGLGATHSRDKSFNISFKGPRLRGDAAPKNEMT